MELVEGIKLAYSYFTSAIFDAINGFSERFKDGFGMNKVSKKDKKRISIMSK